MTGPEHYRKAEEWFARAVEWWEMGDDETTARNATAAAAIGQGHAILAQAAAIGLAIRGADTVAWEAVAGPGHGPQP